MARLFVFVQLYPSSSSSCRIYFKCCLHAWISLQEEKLSLWVIICAENKVIQNDKFMIVSWLGRCGRNLLHSAFLNLLLSFRFISILLLCLLQMTKQNCPFKLFHANKFVFAEFLWLARKAYLKLLTLMRW